METERRRQYISELRDISWRLMCISADIGALSKDERNDLSKSSYEVGAIYQKVRWNIEKQEIAA